MTVAHGLASSVRELCSTAWLAVLDGCPRQLACERSGRASNWERTFDRVMVTEDASCRKAEVATARPDRVSCPVLGRSAGGFLTVIVS